MLDADSVIAPGFFDACEQALAAGTDAVQARSESKRGHTLATEASLAAFALQGVTLPRGRDRLGLSVRLRGTGMAIRRPLALAHRFRAPASEDLVFTLDLILDGVRCRHVDAARLRSEGESSWSTFGGQKVRYEAGRMAAARAYVPRLLKRAIRHRDAACLEAAWFLATPPFALAALSLLAASPSPRSRGLGGRRRIRRWTGRAHARHRHRPGPGPSGTAHMDRAARGPVVPRVEGRRPVARRSRACSGETTTTRPRSRLIRLARVRGRSAVHGTWAKIGNRFIAVRVVHPLDLCYMWAGRRSGAKSCIWSADTTLPPRRRGGTAMSKWLALSMAVLAFSVTPASAAAPRDRDHDGLPDRWERKHRLSIGSPSARGDPDGDGLTNRRELRLRTHPRRADTDRDGLRDGAEVRRHRTDPRSATPTATGSATGPRSAGHEPARSREPPEPEARTRPRRRRPDAARPRRRRPRRRRPRRPRPRRHRPRRPGLSRPPASSSRIVATTGTPAGWIPAMTCPPI